LWNFFGHTDACEAEVESEFCPNICQEIGGGLFEGQGEIGVQESGKAETRVPP
jgi:hypothetical protein